MAPRASDAPTRSAEWVESRSAALTRADEVAAAVGLVVVRCVLAAVMMTTPVDVPGLAIEAPTTVVMVTGPALLAEPEAEREDDRLDEAEEDEEADDDAELEALLADDDAEEEEDESEEETLLLELLRLLGAGKTMPASDAELEEELELRTCLGWRFCAPTTSPEKVSSAATMAIGLYMLQDYRGVGGIRR